jgi:hypothetical protein
MRPKKLIIGTLQAVIPASFPVILYAWPGPTLYPAHAVMTDSVAIAAILG